MVITGHRQATFISPSIEPAQTLIETDEQKPPAYIMSDSVIHAVAGGLGGAVRMVSGDPSSVGQMRTSSNFFCGDHTATSYHRP